MVNFCPFLFEICVNAEHNISMETIEEFVKKYVEIIQRGKVETHRKGNTGVGKTLEDLLGIIENNLQGPDFGVYELKSHRINSNSMLTIFTKKPDSLQNNLYLLDNYGYITEKGKKELHISLEKGKMTSTKDKKHKLSVDIYNDKLYIIDENGKTPVYWKLSEITKSINKKYAEGKIVYALALSFKEKGTEFFEYKKALLANGISSKKIIDLFKDGKIIVDIRIGTFPNGRIHDHGTGFRIKTIYQPELFEHVIDLIENYKGIAI